MKTSTFRAQLRSFLTPIRALAVGLALLATATLVGCDDGDGSGMPGPDAGMPGASVQIESPEDGTTLTEARVDVQARFEATEDDPVRRVRLDVGRQPGATAQVEDGTGGTHTFTDVDLSAFDATERPVALRVVAEFDGGRRLASPPVQVLVDTRLGGQRQLAEVSEGPVRLRWNRGVPYYIGMNVPAEGSDPVDRALGLLRAHPDLFQIAAPDDTLALGRIRQEENGTYVHLVQHAGGLPVPGSQLVIALEGERIRAFHGNYVPDLPEQVSDPAVTIEQAERVASGAVDSSSPTVVGHTREVVYVDALFDWNADSERARHAWRVAVRGGRTGARSPFDWIVYVDAGNGQVLNTVQHVYDINQLVIDSNGEESSTCYSWAGWKSLWTSGYEKVCDEDGCDSGADGDSRNARSNTRTTYNRINSMLGWRGHDGSDSKIKDVMNIPNGGNDNAFYSPGCDHFEFTNGMASLDVVAHEYGHGVVEHTGARMRYQRESGALNEHVADVFGAWIDGLEDSSNSDDFDPIIGEDASIGQIRDMSHQAMWENDPDHYSSYTTLPLSNDNGGVHTYSGIPNKAAWLLAVGGSHTGRTITPIGAEKLIHLMFETLDNRLGRSTGLQAYASAMNAQAEQFHRNGRHGFNSDHVCNVRNAFDAVGLDSGDSDCDGTPDDQESDDDNDGVDDGSDNCPMDYNPNQNDIDGNGDGNACDSDMDGDGTPNVDDNCPETPNPMQNDGNSNGEGDACEDRDNDGYPVAEDNCPEDANRDQLDSDGDGQGDVCDSDRDGDGELNADDNCPDVQNGSQRDEDGDGYGDACDDEDGDGVLDVDDNCPNDYNPQQLDTDGDGLPDACTDDDDDNDGVPDTEDNCPKVQNEQIDGDRDGVGDACDNCVEDPNPEQRNNDGDRDGDVCDDDDDNDGIDDTEDNCPDLANAGDQEGGGECTRRDIWGWLGGTDPDQLGVYIAAAAELEKGIANLGRVPVKPCTEMCPDWLPDGYGVSVSLEARYDFAVAVVDDLGRVITRVDPGDTTIDPSTERYQATVTFEPEASAYYETGSARRGAYQGRTYSLEVVADPNFDYLGSAPMDMQVSRGMDVP
jgi:Zn-dependent metalloprotease